MNIHKQLNKGINLSLNNIQITMAQCHLCAQQHNNPVNSQNNFLAKCCMKRCNKKYCIKCINDKFDTEFQSQMYKFDTWICYSCQAKCACTICKGISNDKKFTKRKNPPAGHLKNETKIQNIKEEVFQDFYSTQKIQSAQPFMRRILQRRNHIYKLMANYQSTEIMKNVPQNAEQKSQEVVVKQEEKPLIRNIKQLISKTLKQYSDDQIDIQLID